MKGQHAAPRRGIMPDGIVLAALAALPVIALTLALGILSGTFLAARAIARIAARIPPRAWLWTGAFAVWPLSRAVPDALIGDGWLPELVLSGTISAACLAALWTLRRRQRRQWRETAGRMDGRPRANTESQVAANMARLDEHSGQLDGLEALRDEVEALKAGVAAAFAAAGTPAPPAGTPAPERHLYVVPGPDDDTKPFGQIA